MLTLGIDPGTATTGYGLLRGSGSSYSLVEYGTITTPADMVLSLRLQILYAGLSRLLLTQRPDHAVVEQVFFSRNARTALAVGHARGVVLLALAEAGIPISEYTPAQLKQAIVGYGRGRKEQVQEMVRVLLRLDAVPAPDDAADALALAICHVHSEQMRRVVATSS